jgi:hypothetical protein
LTPKDGHFLSENKQFDVLRATGPTAEQKKPEELSAEQCDETNDHRPILATPGESRPGMTGQLADQAEWADVGMTPFRMDSGCYERAAPELEHEFAFVVASELEP